MPLFIENRNGEWRVQNPVDPDENFSDKWNEYPERREAFVQWLKKVDADFTSVSKSDTLADGLSLLEGSLGSQTMAKVSAKLGVRRASAFPAIVSSQPLVPVLADTRHAQVPQWPLTLNYSVKVTAGIYFKKGNKKGRFLWSLIDKPESRNVWLRFAAKTEAPKPYLIRWQVVNTGQEALSAGQARGDFYDSTEPEKGVRWESTAYRGTHWVEAFVVKDGICVARSGKVFVKIR